MSVVLFACFSFVLKLPATVKSLVDVMHFDKDFREKDAKGKINLFYDHYCIVASIYETYQKLASFLFFLYMFDKRFLMEFKIAYSRLFSNKVAHKEFVKALEKHSIRR